MAYTEHYCDPVSGSNMNGGSDPNAAPSYAATNGGWNSGTGVFTPTSGNPSLSVTVGQMASVFTDGATTPVFVGRVTAVNATTVTVSTTAKSGTAPGTAASGVSINVGGAWKGPNGAVAFPFGFLTNAQLNAGSNPPRVNFKNSATYSITAAMTHANTGSVVWQGYTATAGDGGRATFDGGTSGASYALLTLAAAAHQLADLVFQNNGASGSAGGLAVGNNAALRRVTVNSVRGTGFALAALAHLVECEAYACNQSNTAGLAGFDGNTGGTTYERCVSHDNAGSNSAGFRGANGSHAFVACIADTNGLHGFSLGSFGNHLLAGCEAYSNGGDGLNLASLSQGRVTVENCNFVKNGGYGVLGPGYLTGSTNNLGVVRNCGFGSGTQANTSGTTNGLGGVEEVASVTYPSGLTPWVDPANGDFRINLAAAKGTGRGAFLQTQGGYAGTVAYPDIGAAQHVDAGRPPAPLQPNTFSFIG